MLRKDHIVPASIIGRFVYLPEGGYQENKINWRRQEVLKRDICEGKTERVLAEDIGYSVGEQDANFTSKNLMKFLNIIKIRKLWIMDIIKGIR